MINNIRKLSLVLFSLIPLFLITGPAIPDLVITLGVIFAIIWILIIEKNYELFNSNFVKISLTFWLSLILISFFSINKTKSFEDSIIFIRFLLIPLSVYFIFFTNNKDVKRVLLVICVLVLLVSLDTLYQFFNYSSKDGFGNDILGFKSDWYGRLTGPFGDELIPGAYISKFGLLGYAYLVVSKKYQSRSIIQIIYLTLILIVCFASGERMALATYLLGLFVLLFFIKNGKFIIFFSLFIGLSSIFLIYKFHPFYNDFVVVESNETHQGLKIEKIYKCNKNSNKMCSKIIDIQPSFKKVITNFSTSNYGEIYLLAIEMFKDNPLTGIGINNYEYACNNVNGYRKLMKIHNCANHPHNIYLQWLTEGGIIVFISFIIYLGFILYFIRKNDGQRDLKLISFAVLVIIFWPIMSTGSLIKNWNGVSTFYIIGICLCLSRFKKNY